MSDNRLDFIEEKLKVLDNLNKKLEEDLVSFKQTNPSMNPKLKDQKGIKVSKEMILIASNCDSLSEV